VRPWAISPNFLNKIRLYNSSYWVKVNQSLIKIEDQGVIEASWELGREVWLSQGLATRPHCYVRRCDNIGSKINCLLFLRLSSAILFVWLLSHLLPVQSILGWGWSLLRTLRVMLLLIKGLCVSSGLILEGIPNKFRWCRHFSLTV
jgi:hypothetical protein